MNTDLRSVILCWFSVLHLNYFFYRAALVRAVRPHPWQQSDWLPVALTSITLTNHHRRGGVIHHTVPASLDTSGPMTTFPWFNAFSSPVAVRTIRDECLTDAHPERETSVWSHAERNELLQNIRFFTQWVKMSLERSWVGTWVSDDKIFNFLFKSLIFQIVTCYL